MYNSRIIAALFLALMHCITMPQETFKICGIVTTQKKALSHAHIKLYQACTCTRKPLAQTEADRYGSFFLSFDAPKNAPVYLIAKDPCNPEIVLAAGFIAQCSLQKAIVNELTTVATIYALAPFIYNTCIFGPCPGLYNSFGTLYNLVDIRWGIPGCVISNFENGSDSINPTSTQALQMQNTLAHLITACACSKKTCKELFASISAATGKTICTTFQAIHAIARAPFEQDNDLLYAIASQPSCIAPILSSAPDAWVLALHYIDGGFNAPGRMAFDGWGRVWSNNNFMPPAGILPNFPGRQVTVLDPQGFPILGSPIFSEFVFGSGYGTAVDACNNGWISSFESGQIAQFSPCGTILQQRDGFNFPMGMAFDQQGNLWMANMGDPTDEFDFGSISVLIKGDVNNRIDHTLGIHKPFSVAIDGKGQCWVANSGFIPVGSVTILKLLPNNTIMVVQQDITSAALNAPLQPGLPRPYGLFASPKTIAIDAQGNGWINNLEVPQVTFINGTTFAATDYMADPLSRGWGLAVDGNGLIWAASFTNPPLGPLFQEPPVISILQGTGTNRGTFLHSFSNPALQHVTALQIDASGNVWVANNWSLATTPTQIIGGDGLVQFIGLATPVQTPLIGLPKPV